MEIINPLNAYWLGGLSPELTVKEIDPEVVVENPLETVNICVEVT